MDVEDMIGGGWVITGKRQTWGWELRWEQYREEFGAVYGLGTLVGASEGDDRGHGEEEQGALVCRAVYGWGTLEGARSMGV